MIEKAPAKRRQQILRGLAFVILLCGLLPAAAEAQFSQQGPKLVGTDAAPVPPAQGWSVALSGDGNTAIFGGPDDNRFTGAAWVFTRAQGMWTQQAELVGTGASRGTALGWSVALSADGNTAILGGDGDNDGVGAAWVFTRAQGVWTQQAKLVGTGAIGEAAQGSSVALSADGNTAIIGGYNDNGQTGAAWIFERVGPWWTQQAKLVGAGAIGNASQGYSVALSGDGHIAVIGGPGDNGSAGAAWIFERLGPWWTQQAKLVGTGAIGNALLGSSAALSADGHIALLGGYADNNHTGAAWVFTGGYGGWTQQAKLVGTGAVGSAPPEQGYSVALSGLGNTALLGGPGDNDQTGAAWVFAFAGMPGHPGCLGDSVAASAREFGGLANAAAALGFSSVETLQNAVIAVCRRWGNGAF
jgi:FG-GAP repeat